MKQEKLLEIFQILLEHFGSRGWWPAETPFEVVVGAILTQSVAWRNVEKAIANLAHHGLLTPEAILLAPDEVIEEAIRPTRYYRMKTKKLKSFCRYLVEEYGGSLEEMFKKPWLQLRQELLGVWGLGPETVDSILLYAGEQPSFVVDAYTRRIWSRLGELPEEIDYHTLRSYFMERLPPDIPLYNELHALIDGVGNRYCRASNPRCRSCPLHGMCKYFLLTGEGPSDVEL